MLANGELAILCLLKKCKPRQFLDYVLIQIIFVLVSNCDVFPFKNKVREGGPP
jgi:hypothetical protein